MKKAITTILLTATICSFASMFSWDGRAIVPQDLACYMPLDSVVNANTILDLSTNNLTGYITNNNYTIVSGVIGAALWMSNNAVTNFVVAKNYNFNTSKMSAFIWVNGTNKAPLLGQYDVATSKRCWLINTASTAWGAVGNELGVGISNDGTSVNAYYSTNKSILDGNWHHVGFVFDSAEPTLYVDGVSVAKGKAASFTITNLLTPNFALSIGLSSSVNPSGNTKNKLQQVRVYNRAITSNEVYQIYAAGH